MRDRTLVFLSYARDDGEESMRMVEVALTNAGAEVWQDSHLEPGTPSWVTEIQRRVERADYVVVVLTPAAKASAWVGNEVAYALATGRTVVPVLALGDERSSVPISLIQVQRIDLRVSGQLTQLADAVVQSPLAPTTAAPASHAKPTTRVSASIPEPPDFRIVLRGYEPTVVDEYISAIAKARRSGLPDPPPPEVRRVLRGYEAEKVDNYLMEIGANEVEMPGLPPEPGSTYPKAPSGQLRRIEQA